MDVFLDTQVLRSDPFWRRASSAALKLLAASGVVRIHISDVTAREFIGWRTTEADAVAKTAETALRKAAAFTRDSLATSILELSGKLAEAATDAKAEMEAAFGRWCAELNVTVWPVRESHGPLVIDAYFAGAAPFRQPKERSDFPDAFIFEAFRDMARNADVVAFVSGDQRFADACGRDFPDAKVCSTLDELLTLEPLATALREKTIEGQFTSVAPLLQSAILQSVIAREQIAAAMVGRRIVVHYPVAGAATVENVETVRAMFVGGTLQYFGAGIVTLPFSARASVNVVAIQDATRVDAKVIARHATIRRAEGDTLEVLLQRMLVVSGEFLVALPPRLFEVSVATAELEREIANAEVVLESLSIFGERPGAVAFEDLIQHVTHEANAQIEAGDLDASLEDAEEADRLARAQWRDVPPELVGQHGDITIRKDARFQIAPMPRFENLVRIAKQTLLAERDTPSGEDGAAF